MKNRHSMYMRIVQDGERLASPIAGLSSPAWFLSMRPARWQRRRCNAWLVRKRCVWAGPTGPSYPPPLSSLSVEQIHVALDWTQDES